MNEESWRPWLSLKGAQRQSSKFRAHVGPLFLEQHSKGEIPEKLLGRTGWREATTPFPICSQPLLVVFIYKPSKQQYLFTQTLIIIYTLHVLHNETELTPLNMKQIASDSNNTTHLNSNEYHQ